MELKNPHDFNLKVSLMFNYYDGISMLKGPIHVQRFSQKFDCVEVVLTSKKFFNLNFDGSTPVDIF